ncbi:dynactin subunit 4 [Atheta coriaria]|uniref:dynactin subunit 4 n=1 Tax=Dalotia coriaria TaxID=877792 RepID=UPI0031F41566
MAYIVNPDVVHYACSCGLLKPISRLYFCRHCLELRCGFCVCHEVDSLFCGKCLDNRTSKEAAERKNKCLNCFICPSCQQQLSMRSSTVKSTEGGKESSKVVYLICLWCRWTTRDVGISDQPVGNNRWPERDNVYANRLHGIQERYKALVLAEMQQKLEKDKKRQKKYVTYTERTGITAAMIRKKLGIPDVPNPHLKNKINEAEPAIPHEDVDELPEELLTQPIILTNITTLDQRLIQPDMQPTVVDKLYPVRKQLSVKQSLRCRSCEHNVSKPEYNPNSIKFKIQLFAYYYVPEVRIFTVEPLRVEKKCELLLKFVNPTQYQTTIKLLPYYKKVKADFEAVKQETDVSLDTVEDSKENVVKLEVKEVKEEKPETKESKEPTSLTSLPSLASLSITRQQSTTIKPRPCDAEITADLIIPECSFILPPRDDAAEYDDTADSHNYQDDPKVVVHRKCNKATIRLQVIPKQMELGEEVVVAFTMQHIYTTTSMENKEPIKTPLEVPVFLSLGKVVGSQ